MAAGVYYYDFRTCQNQLCCVLVRTNDSAGDALTAARLRSLNRMNESKLQVSGEIVSSHFVKIFSEKKEKVLSMDDSLEDKSSSS